MNDSPAHSALFAGDSNTELTYRLSLRAAKVLRATTGERVELFKRIKKLYGTRSKVVHGGTMSKDRLAADATEAMALLRAAITAWLDADGYDAEQLDELLLEYRAWPEALPLCPESKRMPAHSDPPVRSGELAVSACGPQRAELVNL